MSHRQKEYEAIRATEKPASKETIMKRLDDIQRLKALARFNKEWKVLDDLMVMEAKLKGGKK